LIYEKIANLEPIKEHQKKMEAQGGNAEDQMEILPEKKNDLYKMLGKREEELLENFENLLEDNDDDSDGEKEGTKEDQMKRIEFDPKDVLFIIGFV